MSSSSGVDVLTDLLQRSGARGAAFSRTVAHGAWGVRFGGGAALAVHVVVEGEVHLWTTDPDRAVRLLPGDIVLVRDPAAQHLAHAPGAPCRPSAEVMTPGTGVSNRMSLGQPGDGSPTTFFCGAYRFDGDLAQGLLAALPDLLPMRPAAGSTLRATLDLLAGEMLRDEPGQQTLLRRRARRRRAPGGPRRSGTRLDRRRARRRGLPVALGIRPPVLRAPRDGAPGLPQ